MKALYRILHTLGLKLAHKKTYIGRASNGFYFLGYHFLPGGLTAAPQTIQRMQLRTHRLYEQGATPWRLGMYVKHWLRWLRAGLPQHLWQTPHNLRLLFEPGAPAG